MSDSVADLRSPLTRLREELDLGAETPMSVARTVSKSANGNALRNTYLWFREEALLREAAELERRFGGAVTKPPLYGVPVSLKDCFDLAGTVTSAGTRFYAERNGVATRDSAMAERLRAAGVLITGKTHLHPLAYGITGQNPEYGDCLQPRDAALLTGGSSSGAAASVQEGSALAAIGTDTGGSVRVPAALCGLVGYRASHALAYLPGPWAPSPEGLWRGGMHLAPSFDTVGILLRDPRDAAPIADALFGVGVEKAWNSPRIGYVGGAFLADCDAEVMEVYGLWRERLGAMVFDASGLEGAQEIFAGIQAHEAAALHRGYYDAFEPTIAQRLWWGASLSDDEAGVLRARMKAFREEIYGLFERYEFVMMPCAPVRRLIAAEDQASARQRILRYTTPFSLGGMPVLSLPGEMVGGAKGTGVQIAAPPGRDAALLALATMVG